MAAVDKKENSRAEGALFGTTEPKPFTVRAIQLGYYGHLREEGDTFEIYGEEAFSDQWMQKVD